MERKVREQYDRLAASYDDRWRGYLSGTLGLLSEGMSLSGGEKMLDVACGTGELEKLLLSEHPRLEMVGVDMSENMLAVAREKLSGRGGVSFERGRADGLPFPDKTFDVVVTANSFHYFNTPVASLREMRRVTRSGGRIVVLDWCRDFLASRLCDVALKVLDPVHRRCYSQRELREMMASAGLKVTAERKVRLRVVWGIMIAEGFTGEDFPTTQPTADESVPSERLGSGGGYGRGVG